MKYEFKAEPWEYAGEAAWVFVTLPKAMGKEIKQLFGNDRPGFGSIRVGVSTGDVAWQTSIFPDKTSGSYVLPLKAAVRKQAKIAIGHPVKISLSIRQD